MATVQARTWAAVRRALVCAYDLAPEYTTEHMGASDWADVLRGEGAPADWHICAECGSAWIAGDGDRCDICGK